MYFKITKVWGKNIIKAMQSDQNFSKRDEIKRTQMTAFDWVKSNDDFLIFGLEWNQNISF